MSSKNNKTIKINENNLTDEALLKESRFIKLVENFLNKKNLNIQIKLLKSGKYDKS